MRHDASTYAPAPIETDRAARRQRSISSTPKPAFRRGIGGLEEPLFRGGRRGSRLNLRPAFVPKGLLGALHVGGKPRRRAGQIAIPVSFRHAPRRLRRS